MISTHSYLKSVVNMSVNKEEIAVNGGDNPTDVWENSTVWTVGECCCWGICHGFHDHLLNSIISWNLSLPRRQLLDFQRSSLFWHFISIKMWELKVLLIKLKNENARMPRRSLASPLSLYSFQPNTKLSAGIGTWKLKGQTACSNKLI